MNQRIDNRRPRTLRSRPALHLAHKLMIAIGAAMFALLAATWYTINTSVESLLSEHALQYGRTLTQVAANTAADGLLAEDRLQVSVLLSTISHDPALRGAALYQKDGKRYAYEGEVTALSPEDLRRLAFQTRLPDNSGNTVPFVAPVQFHGAQVGYLQLTLDRVALERALRGSLRKIGIVIVVMLALAAATAYWLARRIAEPIDRLALATRALREGRYELLINERRDDEIGEIIHALNDLAQNLQRKLISEKNLSRFVSSAVAQHIIDGEDEQIGGRTVHATVLFVDMVGFTSLSERLPAQQVADLLNHCFTLLNRTVRLCNGNVDKYIGDGAMVLFGAPAGDSEHAFRAISCAYLFMKLMADFQQENPGIWPKIQFRVGIHSGEMIAGNMGSVDRMQYTVVGDSVNQAARLCETAHAGEIWISDAVLAETSVRERIQVETRGSVRLKGKTESTICFRVADLNAPYAQIAQRQVQHLLGPALENA